MSSAYCDTKINSYDAQLWGHSDSQPVREFAAAVGRANPGIRRLDTSVRHDVEVWVQLSPDVDNAASIPTPDGFDVVEVTACRSGGVCVDYERVDA